MLVIHNLCRYEVEEEVRSYEGWSSRRCWRIHFFLETLEEELLSLPHAVNTSKAAAAVEGKEEAAPPEDDGWMEVGKRNRTVITYTNSCSFSEWIFFESVITRVNLELLYAHQDKNYMHSPARSNPRHPRCSCWHLAAPILAIDTIYPTWLSSIIFDWSAPPHIGFARRSLWYDGFGESWEASLGRNWRLDLVCERMFFSYCLVLQLKKFGYDTTGVAKVG